MLKGYNVPFGATL